MPRKGQRLRFIAETSAEPMSPQEQRAAERLLARLIARAHAADHPGLFGPRLTEVLGIANPGPSAAAAEVSAAPPPGAGGPKAIERHHG